MSTKKLYTCNFCKSVSVYKPSVCDANHCENDRCPNCECPCFCGTLCGFCIKYHDECEPETSDSDSESEKYFTCTECKDLFEVEESIWPCQCNDGSCPTLCDTCQEKTGLIKSCNCGVFCDKHKHECVCEK